MPNIENIKKYKKIHMIGIGGVSMSGIAEILTNWGFEVSGSDRSDSEILHILNDAGIKTFIGHNAENITNQDCVVYTAAISQDNPELVRAKELNIPIIERSDFLVNLQDVMNILLLFLVHMEKQQHLLLFQYVL